MEPIKIIMLGGRRCGKTSALASMFDQMQNGPVNRFLTSSDETKKQDKVISPLTGEIESQDSLTVKAEELEGFFSEPRPGKFDYRKSIFLIDQNPTYNIWRYTLRMKDPHEGRDIFNRYHFDIDFYDIPGEYCRDYIHVNDNSPITSEEIKSKMEKLLNESDICMIMVDTPYLMEADDSICKTVNCVKHLKSYLQNILDGEAKLVVFVPIKCEKWVKNGKIGEVNERIREIYQSIITDLGQPSRSKVSVAIVPIETAGNIVFCEFKDAKLVTFHDKEQNASVTVRCCETSDSKYVRLESGEIFPIESAIGKIQDDPHAKIQKDSKMLRPYSWFKMKSLKKKDWKYEPHNCDVLAMHLLKFIVEKYSQEGPSSWGRFFGGGITKGRMKEILKSIEESGLIIENTDGIEYIQKRI